MNKLQPTMVIHPMLAMKYFVQGLTPQLRDKVMLHPIYGYEQVRELTLRFENKMKTTYSQLAMHLVFQIGLAFFKHHKGVLKYNLC